MYSSTKGLGVSVTLAPVIFTAHFLEESPGFVEWFNAHVRNGITTGLFWNVNISALVITIVIMLIEIIGPSFFSASLTILWFSFLMLANAIFHITGAIMDRHYMPGVITAVILYLPYYCFDRSPLEETKTDNWFCPHSRDIGFHAHARSWVSYHIQRKQALLTSVSSESESGMAWFFYFY